ncbi:protein kinase domain-containing protein [Desulfosarcina cetonica]|uniref:protein kinase domain-containing protein n=1 Tax=Desulfosarcina cetonica TaxID=90730 RepID=UPI0009FB11DE
MGAVYLAQQEATGKQVALKVMLPQMAANKDAVARFCREMDNAKALRHPHIVQSFESGFADNVFYLTMEVCNAGSLQDLLQKKRRPARPR